MSKNTKAEVRRRVGIVYKLQVAGLSRQEIIHVCNEKYGWHACDRTIDNYSAEASVRFVEEIDADGREETGKAWARYLQQYRHADARGDHRGAAAIVDKMVALKGLAAAKRTEHSGPDGGPIQVSGALQALEEEIVAAVIAGLDEDGDGQGTGTAPA